MRWQAFVLGWPNISLAKPHKIQREWFAKTNCLLHKTDWETKCRGISLKQGAYVLKLVDLP
jgi:hypothetical protein